MTLGAYRTVLHRVKLFRHVLLAVLILATAALAAACGSGTGSAESPSTASGSALVSPSDATAASTGADWPEFDQNAARTGTAPGVPAPGRLVSAWTASLDGAVYGQPLVIGGRVITATENDTIYALSRTTGRVVWRSHVGTPVPQAPPHGCGNIFPLGITGTPVYNPGNGLVYAVAEVTGYQHLLVGVDAATGAIRLRRALDIPTDSNQPAFNQQRPALAIDDGRVYATFGGLAGDCGPYQGSVVSAPLTGNGPLARWQVPTSREGAIWATGGAAVGPDGNLWVSVGNGAAGPGDAYDGSDSVTELSPGLQRIAFFAPSTWADDNADDLDLGSTQPVLAAGGAVFIMGKRGTGYLLSASAPGGVGGQLAQQDICRAFGTAAVTGSTVYEPCSDGGVAAVKVDAAARTIKVLWRGPPGSNGTPVVGGGAVWVTQYSNDGGPGTLYALDQATGQVEQQITIGQGLPHFSSLALSGGTAYVSTLTGITAVNGA
jgi:polyvinyl alcohol dehydrogenase (cytochrome)